MAKVTDAKRSEVSERGGFKWRMESPCENCPFNASGPGLHLRRSLRRGRWLEITRGLLRGTYFTCHKTTHETGDGSDLVCAGAIAWQERRGASSNLQRVMERLSALTGSQKQVRPSDQPKESLEVLRDLEEGNSHASLTAAFDPMSEVE